MERYFVYFDDGTIGIKFDPNKQELHVGGYNTCRKLCELTMSQCFDRDPYGGKASKVEERQVQKNKMRFVALDYPVEKFREGIAALEDQGFTVSATKSLDRIMR